MRYTSALAFVKKNYLYLGDWIQSTIGAPEVQFPDRANVNGDLVLSTTGEHSSFVQGAILIWIASGRPLGVDGWASKKEEVKKIFIGMTVEELKAYLKSNNTPPSPPPQRPLPALPTATPARTVQSVATPVRNVQPAMTPMQAVGVQQVRNVAVVQPVQLPVQPSQRGGASGRRLSAHGPVLAQHGAVQANAVPLPTPATSNNFAKCLPDQGPGTMTTAPGDLINKKRQALGVLCDYAVGDATRFNGPEPAKDKEKALRSNPQRLQAMKAAEQAAGGVIHYPQSKLKSAYDKTVEAQGAVCTTFALCAAHILTDGSRQTGKVRVEIIGVNRNLGTHMYVVCGRAGNNLADLSTWGSNAVIVDLWAAALAGHKTFDTRVESTSTDWRLKGGPLGQFYDNARADPKEEELAREVNVASLNQSTKQTELVRLEKELQETAAFAKVKREDLAKRIASLKKELGLPT